MESEPVIPTQEEVVAIVDERNQLIASAPRRIMRARRLIHRATYVLVFNGRGELYVQQRTLSKDVCPGYWDPAAGGVVQAGESYEESARRELAEELGIRDVAMNEHCDFYFEDERARAWGRVFSCVYDGELVLQPEEVASVRLMTVEQVLAALAGGERFTPDSLEALRRYQAATQFEEDR